MNAFLRELGGSLGSVGAGILTTVEATVLGALLALVVAFALGLLALSRRVVVRGLVRVVVEFFRGTSLYVQLFWLFYALPILGLRFAPMACGVLALGLCYGAYGAEVVRGAINAVPRAQWEATVALNLTPFQRMRLVILPQAWLGMIPPFNNLLIQLLKCTPLLSLVTIADLTFEAQQLRGATGESEIAYLFLLIVYFVLAYLFTLMMNALESVAKAKLGRGPGLAGMFRLRAADATGETAGLAARAGR